MIKVHSLLFWLLLIVTNAIAQNPNKQITVQMLNGTVYPCYYKTYNDFLKGNAVPAHSVKVIGNLVFTIGGKPVSIKPNDIWGFRDNNNRLIRINHDDQQLYAVYGVGDVIYYDDNVRYTPAEEGWGGGSSPYLIADYGMSVHYKKDGSVVHAYYANDNWHRSAVSANLNSPMITHKQFEDDKTFYALAAGDTSLLNFGAMWPRLDDKMSRINIKNALFVIAFDFKSNPVYVAYSHLRGKEIYFK